MRERALASLEWDSPTDEPRRLSAYVLAAGRLDAFLDADPDAAALLERLMWAFDGVEAAGLPDRALARLRQRALVRGEVRVDLSWEIAARVARRASECPPLVACLLGRMSPGALTALAGRLGVPPELSRVRAAFTGAELGRRLGRLPAGCNAQLMAMVDRPDDAITVAAIPARDARTHALLAADLLLPFPSEDAPQVVLPLDVAAELSLVRGSVWAEAEQVAHARLSASARGAPPSPSPGLRAGLRAHVLLDAGRPLPDAVTAWIRERGGARRLPAAQTEALARSRAALDLPESDCADALLASALGGYAPLEPAMERLFGVRPFVRELSRLGEVWGALDRIPPALVEVVTRWVAERVGRAGLSLEEARALRDVGARTITLIERRMGRLLARLFEHLVGIDGSVARGELDTLAWHVAVAVAVEDRDPFCALQAEWGGRAPLRSATDLASAEVRADAGLFVDALLGELLVPLGFAHGQDTLAGSRIGHALQGARVAPEGTRARVDLDGETLDLRAGFDAPLELVAFLLAGFDPQVEGDVLRFRVPGAFATRLSPERAAWLGRSLRASVVSERAVRWLDLHLPDLRYASGVTWVEAADPDTLARWLAGRRETVLLQPTPRTAVLRP